MILRSYIIATIFIFLFASCKKNENTTSGSNNTVEASTQLNVQYGSDPLQNMDMYLPANRSAATKVMILIHGGAWAAGDKADFNGFVDTLKRRQTDYAIFNINYRLASGFANFFPTQEMDTKAAVEYIYSKKLDYKIGDKFVMLGASAGGHLSLLQAYKYQTPIKIKVVVDFFGPSDMNEMYNAFPTSIPFLIEGLATPVSNPAIYFQSSPINFVSNIAACPTIILQGDADTLVNHTIQSERLRDKLQIAGVAVQYVPYPGKDHGVNWGSAYFDAFNKIQSFLSTYNP